MTVIADAWRRFAGMSQPAVAGVSAVAAVFSAIAAGAAAYAAFGQEKATYHTALYEKQVEEISAFNHAFRDLLKDVETDTTPSEDVKTQFTLTYEMLILVSPPQAARPVNELAAEIVADRSHDKHKTGVQEARRLERVLISYLNCAQLQLSTGYDLNGDRLMSCFQKDAASDLRSEPNTPDSKRS